MAKGGIFWLVNGSVCAIVIGVFVWLGLAGVVPVGDVLQLIMNLGALVLGLLAVPGWYSADPNALVGIAVISAASVVVIINYGTGGDGSQLDDGRGRCPNCGGDG